MTTLYEERTTTQGPADDEERIGMILRLYDTGLTVANTDEDVRGRRVKDVEGEDLGKVDELLVDDAQGKIRFLEVGAGGFLGLGKAKSMIPVEAICAITEDEVQISSTPTHPTDEPGYDPDVVVDTARITVAETFGATRFPYGPF